MDEVTFDEGVAGTCTSLMTGRLALLVGAGLSMAPPSGLPSAAEIAAAARHRHDALYGPNPPLAAGIEAQAEYFFQRHELATVYFRTLIDPNAFAGRPNPGHSAIADLLLVQAIQLAITTNVDALVETAGGMLYGQVGVCIDGHRVAQLPPDTMPYLKIHGCRTCDFANMVWAPGQILEPPVSDRIASSTIVLNDRLLDRDLLIVGYWTDWDYLNSILAATLGAVNPARVTIVDPAPGATFQAKAPDLYAIGLRASTSFRHVRVSGSDFLDALRSRFSKSVVRQILHSGADHYAQTTGGPPNAAWMEAPDLDNETLWQMRRDLEGSLPRKPSRTRTPPNEPLLGLTLLQLQSAGASADGSYWSLGGRRVRVLRAVGKPLHQVQAEFEREMPPPTAPHLVIAVGAEVLSLPSHIVRGGTSPTIARGGASKWMVRADALVELGI
jgi:hypothetical protein